MGDMRKYISIIEQAFIIDKNKKRQNSKKLTENRNSNGSIHLSPKKESKYDENDARIGKYVSLVESAMRLDESFKDAKKKFVEEGGSEIDVNNYIEVFRNLAKQNIIQGEDKDIGKWIKAGWEIFKDFVDQSKNKKSKRHYKKQVKSDSIKVYEDDEKMVVIPLTEKASCFYGKGTSWCTAATTSANYFKRYFLNDPPVTLFYVIFKTTGEKYAVARSPRGSEYFNSNDVSIGSYKFEELTGIDDDQIEMWHDENENHIENAREKNSPSFKLKKIMEEYNEGIANASMVVATANEVIYDLYENREIEYPYEIAGTDGNDNFIVDIYDDLLETIEGYIGYINGDDFLEVHTGGIYSYENMIDEVSKKIQDKVFQYLHDNFEEEIMDHFDIDEDNFDTAEIRANFDEIMQLELDDELEMAFVMADQDAARSGMEAEIAKSVLYHINGELDKLNLDNVDNLFDFIDDSSYNFTIANNDIPSYVDGLYSFGGFNRIRDIDVDNAYDHDGLKFFLEERLLEILPSSEND